MGRTYTPIDCSYYDLLEHYSTVGEAIAVRFRDSGGVEQEENGRILDLSTREGVEYLKLDNGREIRLDDLISVDGKDVPGICSSQ